MKKLTILLLALSVFAGYAYEFLPAKEVMTFPYTTRTLTSNWYWLLLFKDARSVLLVLAMLTVIPRNEKALRFFTVLMGTMILFVPIWFTLYFSAPFQILQFGFKLGIALIGAFLINYLDNNNESIGNNSNRNI